MAKIKILIDRHGDPTIIDVCGEGRNCMEATKNFEKALGKSLENTRSLTEAFFEEEQELLLTNEATING